MPIWDLNGALEETRNHLSYQNGWDKFVEEDDLDATHIQCDSSVNFRHVQIGVSFCCICIIYHLKGKYLFICYGHSLKNNTQYNSN